MLFNPLSRFWSRIFIPAFLLLLALHSRGTTNLADQMQLGNPSGAIADTNNHNHFLYQLPVEAVDYNDNMGQPNWASWDLTSEDANNAVPRSDNFFTNIYLPPNFFWVPGDPVNPFTGSGYDRGHMCPSADRTNSRTNNDMLFLMSNIIPQKSEQNQGIWAQFENACRTIADQGNEVLITCGPSLFTTNKLYNNRVTIPGYTWKVVVIVKTNNNGSTAAIRITPTNRVIVVRIPNTAAVGSDPWQYYVTNAVAVESDTGYTFFTALAPNLATVLRNKIDGVTPPPPAITGFSPDSGPTNSTVVITGTNFVFATNVTFHGTSAPFTIDSTTQITAIVPAGATSGAIGVATLGGSVNSSSNFSVTISNTFPDLAVLASHNGNFVQGNNADTYTVIVTNIGGIASSGSITVTDALPSALTISAISGAGWTTNLANLTATRSDPLTPGSAYPPITFTVSVSPTAPANVTNVVTVFGGGETNVANNTASDPITILAAAVPTVTTTSATGIGSTTATLNGSINPNNQPAAGQFQYGLTTAYGSNVLVSGTFTGATAQAASASLSGLTPSTTYHFRLFATNVMGGTNGLDQTFTTAAPPAVDLAISKSHSGNFQQGGAGYLYTINITNIGTTASSGSITVTDSVPAGLTVSSMGGLGWTSNLVNLTCTRSDSLDAGSAFPPIMVTVSVATNAPGTLTNIATISGGGDANLANNTVMDVTTIVPAGSTLATNVVISQIYGGGGNTGATYQNDFVELFNPLSTPVNVSTWSVQYASAGGNTWQNRVNLTGSIQPRHYYLIQLQSQAAVGIPLPVADCTNTSINMSASTGGKVALVNSQTALTGANPIGTNVLVDFVGYGSGNAFEGSASARAPSNNTDAMFRKSGGDTDSNNNTNDFLVQTAAPRNSASPTNAFPVADLIITSSHSGNFTQGDNGDTYTISVMNVGASTSSGTVTVTNSLPIGLNATAISGSGWSANLTNLTCSRSDALASAASFPPIVVTINVSTNAPVSVTNLAAVSGGGQSNTANDTAADPTTIIAATPIQLWRYYWFGTTVNSGPSADLAIASSDSMPNLLKYALGLVPIVATNDPVTGDIKSGFLRITAPKNPEATDVTFHPQITTNLTPAAWTTNGTIIETNTSSLFRVRATAPISAATNSFMRLQITRP